MRRLKFDMQHVVQSQLRAAFGDNFVLDGRKIDANETATFARQLEHIFADLYTQEFPEMKARSLIPYRTDVPAGAESHTHTEWSQFGEAKIVHNYAKDFPAVDAQGKQYSDVIKSLGDSYNYSVQDLRAAAMSGYPLSSEKARIAREAMERKFDALALSGDANSGLKGLNTAALVSDYNSVAKTTAGTAWSAQNSGAGVSTDELLNDVKKLFKAVADSTLNVHKADTLAVDTATYNYLAFTPVKATDGSGNPIGFSGQTLLQFIMANVPGLKAVEDWARLNAAAGGTKSRIFAYERSPKVLYGVIPQDFEQFPPQFGNLAFTIPCHMRVGSVVVVKPKAIAYMDGTGSQ